MITPSAVRAVTSRQSGRLAGIGDQRMVAGCRERRGHIAEQTVARVLDLADLAVHHPSGARTMRPPKAWAIA